VSRRLGEVALVVAIVAVAAWLRIVHLGTPSLWWDELVEIRTAERSLAETLRLVRIGLGFGSGNAGAMPADYVLLHAWLHLVPPPAPERLEAYFRTPACAASIVTVLALYGLGRSLFGRATGALAALLLATSMPAILYAAEARSYSLLALMTVVDAAAFARVARAPDRVSHWIVWAVATVLYFLTGVFALLVIGVQYAVLGILLLARRGRAGIVTIVVTAGVFAAVVAGYLQTTAVGATYPRNAVVDPFVVSWQSLGFLAADSTALVAAFLIGVPLALRAGTRRRAGAAAWAIVLAFATLPVIGLAIRWSHYYFHGRHVLFLLPLFHLVLAAGVVELLRLVGALQRPAPTATRRILAAAVAGGFVLALVGPRLRAFVDDPHMEFTLAKTLRDIAPVTRAVAERVAALPAGERYLLVAERNSTANAVLSSYLRWYGLTDRVTLRSPGVPLDRVEPLLREGGGDTSVLALRNPEGLYFGFRILLGLVTPVGDVPPRVSQLGIVAYTTPQRGPDVRRFWGVSLREPAAIAPSPPRS
jgi:hypothetical protein